MFLFGGMNFLVKELVITICPETIIYFKEPVFDKIFTCSFNNKSVSQNTLRIKDRKILILRLTNFNFFEKNKIIFKDLHFSKYTKLPIKFICLYKNEIYKKIENDIFYKNISLYQDLPESFIESHLKHFDIYYILHYQKITDLFKLKITTSPK